MIKSIGVDIVQIERLENDIQKYGDRFVKRILSPDEISQYNQRVDKAQFLAGRFAAKEAIIKALGAYLDEKPALNSIVIGNGEKGEPSVTFDENVTNQLKNANCLLSISHEKDYSVAMAVIAEEK